MADVESLVLRLEADSALMRKELQKAVRNIQGFRRSGQTALRQFDRAFTQMQRRVVSGAGALASAVGAMFTAREIRGALEYGAALQHTSSLVGVTAEELQVLRFAASDFGIEARQADMAVQRFSRRLQDAAQNGRGELLPVLRQMGIDLHNADGTARSTAEVMMDFADAVTQAESPNAQLLAGFKAFDSEGARFILTLARGREGMNQYAAQARELGIVMTNDAARAAAEADRRFDIISQRLRMSFVTGVVESEDAIADLATGIETAIPILLRFLNALGETGEAVAAFLTGGRRDPIEDQLTSWADTAERLADEIERGEITATALAGQLSSSVGDQGPLLAEQFGVNDTPAARASSNLFAGMPTGLTSQRSFLEEDQQAAEALARRLRQLSQIQRDLAEDTREANAAAEDQVEATDEQASALERLLNEQGEGGGGGGGGGGVQQLDFYRQLYGAIRLTTRTLQRQIDATKDGAGAVAELEHQLVREEAIREALAAAQTQSITLTQQQVQAIGDEAEAASRLAAELENLRDQSETSIKIPMEIEDDLDRAKQRLEGFSEEAGQIVGDALRKSADASDFAENLLRNIQDAMIERAIIQPLESWVTGMFSRVLNLENASGAATMGAAISTSSATGAAAMGSAIKLGGLEAAAAMRAALASSSMTSGGKASNLLGSALSLLTGGGSSTGTAGIGAAVSKGAGMAGQTIINAPISINATGADASKLDQLSQEVRGLRASLPNALARRDREKARRAGTAPGSF